MDLSTQSPRLGRTTYLRELISDFDLLYDNSGKTYVDPLGIERTEIDYFLVKTSEKFNYTKKEVMNNIDVNISDHHPVQISVTAKLKQKRPSTARTTHTLRTNWDKIDIELYSESLRRQILSLNPTELNSSEQVENYSMKVMSIIKRTVEDQSKKVKTMNSKPKLKVWTEKIGSALKNMRSAFKLWALKGKPREIDNVFLTSLKCAKKLFRSSYRCEQARRLAQDREKILNSRSRDTKLFYKLVNKQRSKKSNMIDDLNVDGQKHTGLEEVVNGFKIHFQRLAEHSVNQNFDSEVKQNNDIEIKHISDMVCEKEVDLITLEELGKAIKNMNRGKSADIYGLTVESIANGGLTVHRAILKVLNAILTIGEVPQCLKVGLLTPVFKNKGSSAEATNYRGITVLPVIEKLLETVIKFRIVSVLEKHQSVYQRGFTANTSPLHAALIVEEITRNCKDRRDPIDIIFLDAKAAFDVVDHNHLLRRIYHSGVNDKLWSIIQSIHSEATSVVKCAGLRSEPFSVLQGVRQGGILSTDLYKAYVNPLLKRLELTDSGCCIGDVRCNASACADDITINSVKNEETATLISMAEDFANCERYLLQPKKTEALKVYPSNHQTKTDEFFEIYGNQITNTCSSTHLGIKRADTVNATAEANVDHNIQKARRTAYSFMSAGLHGAGGLDIPTTLHVFRMYVSPVLDYGLEIVLPRRTLLNRLELFQKRLLKQLFMLPTNTSDIAIYILSGLLPVEAQIHKKALILFNNVCLQNEGAVERRLAERQLTVKNGKSASWFVEVRRLFWQYELGEAEELLNTPVNKDQWKRTVNKTVNVWWNDNFLSQAQHMKSLVNLNLKAATPGRPHPLLQLPPSSSYDANRLLVKLKFMTGTYILQSNRAAFNQNKVDPTCQLCNEAPETLTHFVLNCSLMSEVRRPIVSDIRHEVETLKPNSWDVLSDEEKVFGIIDCSSLRHRGRLTKTETLRLQSVEFQCRRLLFTLHTERYRHLQILNVVKNKATPAGRYNTLYPSRGVKASRVAK